MGISQSVAPASPDGLYHYHVAWSATGDSRLRGYAAFARRIPMLASSFAPLVADIASKVALLAGDVVIDSVTLLAMPAGDDQS